MKTFSEFIAEGKKKSKISPSSVPDPEDGHREYTLAPHTGSTKPLKKVSKILKLLKDQGGIGAKSVKKGIEQREKELKKLRKKNEVDEGFSYGSKSFQQQLEKKRKQEAEEKQTQRQQNADTARRAFRTKGVPFSDAKGKGHIRNGIKHYDT